MSNSTLADALISRTYCRLSQEQRDRREERNQELYERVFAEIEDEERQQYEDDFGPTYRAKWPYKPDGARTHTKVLKRMKDALNKCR